MSVGTPSVHSRIDKDIYLTITQLPNRDDEPIGLSVVVTPFVWMLWMGGVVIAFAALGTVLSPEKGKP